MSMTKRRSASKTREESPIPIVVRKELSPAWTATHHLDFFARISVSMAIRGFTWELLHGFPNVVVAAGEAASFSDAETAANEALRTALQLRDMSENYERFQFARVESGR